MAVENVPGKKTVKYRMVLPAADVSRRFEGFSKQRANLKSWEAAELEMHPQGGWGFPSHVSEEIKSKREMVGQRVARGTLNAFLMPKTRTAEEVRDLLKAAGNPLAFIGKLRLFDITGSSNDLPSWQVAFNRKVLAREVDFRDRFGSWTKGFPTLSACCSTMPVRLEIRYSDKPNSIVFHNLAYGKAPLEWDFDAKPSVPIAGPENEGMDLAPFFILGNYYGLRGIEVISHPTSPIAKCGGLESSNAFIYGLNWLGNVLSGAGLGQAEIFSTSVFHANYVLGDLTGGQGMSAMMEGGYHTFHYMIPAGMNGYISQEVVTPEHYGAIYSHIDLVQPGKDFSAHDGRSAADINNGWCAALTTPEGFDEQSRIPELAIEFARALNTASEGDENAWKEAARLARAQVAIRVNRGPKYLQGNEEFVKHVEDGGGAAFALGAGGPGAMFAVLGPAGLIQEVRGREGLIPITEQVAIEVLRSNGKLKGYIDYEIDKVGMEHEGVEEAGFGPIPVMPLEVNIDI